MGKDWKYHAHTVFRVAKKISIRKNWMDMETIPDHMTDMNECILSVLYNNIRVI